MQKTPLNNGERIHLEDGSRMISWVRNQNQQNYVESRIRLGMGKSGGRLRPPHRGGGAQVPEGAQRKPRGVRKGTLLSKGTQMTPERPPDARQNAQMAPDPEMHLSENVLSSSPSTLIVSGRVER
jgi:hypothetical protein